MQYFCKSLSKLRRAHVTLRRKNGSVYPVTELNTIAWNTAPNKIKLPEVENWDNCELLNCKKLLIPNSYLLNVNIQLYTYIPNLHNQNYSKKRFLSADKVFNIATNTS